MSPGVEVLLIDDNPSIRELLLHSLSPLANVHSYANAPDALLHAQEQKPDLVVTDHRMPGMSGLDLLLKIVTSVPRVPVVMMASRRDISGPLAGSSPLVEEFIEKPFFVEEAAARIKRVLERVALGKATREAADSTNVRGTLAQMSVVDLLQTVDMGRKNCSLVLIRNGQRAEMQFHDGQLVHATLGIAPGVSLSGEQAVYKVVAWTEGAFLIDFERRECPITITRSTQSVLLEALRIFDESQRDADPLESASDSGDSESGASDSGDADSESDSDQVLGF
jgi:DNA-binding response OmpR family regulator